MRSFHALAAALFAFATCTAALAQQYPSRPIRIIVPFPPGGASDVTARIIGEKLTAAWGQPVVIDNRTGATGIIGTELVARAVPDGHTLGLFSLSFAVNPSIQKLPYDSERDFSFITITASNPLVLVVNNNVPAKSVGELIDLAKAKPDALTYASSGTGSSPHLTAELFKLQTGVKIRHIPYKGSTAAHPDLIGGQVNVMFDTIIAAAPHIKAGRLRALGVTSLKRSSELPGVPTIAESGVPGYESTSWGVVTAPAKLPPALLERLNREIVRILQMPDVRERLIRLGGEPIGNSQEEARKYVFSELRKWAKTVKAADIRVGQ